MKEGINREWSIWNNRTEKEPIKAWSREWKSKRGSRQLSSKLMPQLLNKELYSDSVKKRQQKLSKISSKSVH